MTLLQVLIDEFNLIANTLDHTHWMTGTIYDAQGELVFVDTPWACGMVDAKGVAIG